MPKDEALENRDREGTQAAPAHPTCSDIAEILAQRHYALMGEFLAIRKQLAATQQQLTLANQSATDQGKRFDAGLKAIKAIAAPLFAAAKTTTRKKGKKFRC